MEWIVAVLADVFASTTGHDHVLLFSLDAVGGWPVIRATCSIPGIFYRALTFLLFPAIVSVAADDHGLASGEGPEAKPVTLPLAIFAICLKSRGLIACAVCRECLEVVHA